MQHSAAREWKPSTRFGKRFVQRAEHSIATSQQASHFVTITEVNSSRMHFKMSCDSSAFDRVHHSSGVQKETAVSNDSFEHSRSNCSGSHDSQPSTNSMLRFETLRIDTTITGSSGVLATRRPRSTDAVSSWRLRDLHTNLCQQWDPVQLLPKARRNV